SYHLRPAKLYASARMTDITVPRNGCPIRGTSFTPAVLYRQAAVMRNSGWHLWMGRSARWFMQRRAAIFMEVAFRRTGGLLSLPGASEIWARSRTLVLKWHLF